MCVRCDDVVPRDLTIQRGVRALHLIADATRSRRQRGPQPPLPPPRRRAQLVVTRYDGARGLVPPLRRHTSAASPSLFMEVLARIVENGYAVDVARCVDVCKDAQSNTLLWERVVDVPRRGKGTTRLMHWAREGDLVRTRETLARGARVNARDVLGRTALHMASGDGHPPSCATVGPRRGRQCSRRSGLDGARRRGG